MSKILIILINTLTKHAAWIESPEGIEWFFSFLRKFKDLLFNVFIRVGLSLLKLDLRIFETTRLTMITKI
jgi:hypothetical protein